MDERMTTDKLPHTAGGLTPSARHHVLVRSRQMETYVRLIALAAAVYCGMIASSCSAPKDHAESEVSENWTKTAKDKQSKQFQGTAVREQPNLAIPIQLTNGRLEIRQRPPYSLPLEASERLMIHENGEVLEVKNLEDIVERMSTLTADEALKVVRLRTSPRTFMCFGGKMLEVMPRRAFNAEIVFGDVDFLKRVEAAADSSVGAWCIVPDDQVTDALRRYPEVKPYESGYRITRLLLSRDEQGKTHLREVQEYVGNSSYEIIHSNKITDTSLSRLRLSIPTYE